MKNVHMIDRTVRAVIFLAIVYGMAVGLISSWWFIPAVVGLAYFGKTAYTGACVIYEALGISTLGAAEGKN
jgi:hypothetical protein